MQLSKWALNTSYHAPKNSMEIAFVFICICRLVGRVPKTQDTCGRTYVCMWATPALANSVSVTLSGYDLSARKTTVELPRRKMNRTHLLDWLHLRAYERKNYHREKTSSLTARTSVPHSHFVANGKLYCFLSDVTNIRIKWRKLERQKIRQD